ncbi:MAG: FHA domain-containing protein [Planctomycetes bacterium]|nr:FHA domain-containing protein [Planctomycetota bacterium]
MADQEGLMAQLCWTHPSGTAASLPLEGREMVRIGRHADNDVVLDDLDASRRHALLFHREGMWFLGDLQSRRGTFVNGQRVSVTELKGGEDILIGQSRLSFVLSASDPAPTEQRGQPLVPPDLPPWPYPRPAHPEREAPTGVQSISESRGPVTPPPVSMPTASRLSAALVLEGRPGQGKVIILKRHLNTIGFLPDPTVARLHARIVREADIYWIEDLDSPNGVFVNGKHVRKAALNNHAIVTIGTVTMRFLCADQEMAQAIHPPAPEAEREPARDMDGIVQAIAMTVEMRDPYTAGHQRRVSKLAQAIAREMGLSEDLVEGIRIAGILHDIGKISVPGEILSKPGRISPSEMAIIRAHPHAGFEILKGIDFHWPVAQAVLQHHERMDGSGYGAGLRGNDILQEARILGIADVVEAMASHRPYRPALGVTSALGEISRGSGGHYWAEAVAACLSLFNRKQFTLE